MGIITKIEEQKNKNRVNIFVDDSFFCGLERETAVIFGLKTGKEVDESYLKDAISKSEEKRAFDKSINYISIRNHSKKELYDKLLKKDYNRETIENVLEKLEEYHYIDDEKFAKAFIEQNKKYSKMVLSNKLYQKGIDKEIIDRCLEVVEEDDEFNNCLLVTEKLLKSTKIESFNDKQKLFAKLVRRGFKVDTINNVFSELEISVGLD
ncbi:MAG: RecX family transcriptional regulator [Clostridia bacterium]|nr:RecX family transcriptional regulator [Clostridia bacterium]